MSLGAQNQAFHAVEGVGGGRAGDEEERQNGCDTRDRSAY